MTRRFVLPLLLLACGAPSRHTPAMAPAAAPATAALAGRANAVRADASFEVASEEVAFTAGGRTIGGTLALPKAAGRWPAVLLLAGSGPTDRDWNNPLIATRNGSGALLATELARHGAVVLRFDKAGSGKNPGPPLDQWTLDTYRDEAAAALALLRARPEVRADRVFVAGHSEGGLHATRLAEVARPPLAGVLNLASISRTLIDTTLAQIEAQMRNPIALLATGDDHGRCGAHASARCRPAEGARDGGSLAYRDGGQRGSQRARPARVRLCAEASAARRPRLSGAPPR
jgi:dienelactone hydrolase